MPSRPEFGLVLIAVLASGCTVPEVSFYADDGGGPDGTTEAAAEASGDDGGGGPEAGDDGSGGDGGGAGEGGTCDAAQCCGSVACTGDCSQTNCQTCTTKCGGMQPPQQCCVKNGVVNCHPTSSSCPP